MRHLLPALALLLALTACDSGEPGDGSGEQELITEVTLTLTNSADAGNAVTIMASDPDGDGRDIVFTPAFVRLRAGATYDGAITLRDGTRNRDITAEVREEAEEHLFRYALTPAGAGSVTATDLESDYGAEDTNGGDFAVGLRFRATVAADAAGAGELGVVLYHFDAAPKASSTAASDEIDVDLAFPVTYSVPGA